MGGAPAQRPSPTGGAGAFADVGVEHLHHGGVVAFGVHGEAFEGVDAAEADVELVVTELGNGLGVAVGELALQREAVVVRWLRPGR